MKKNKWGRIVHVSSSAAYNYSAPVAYSSAKAALNTYVSSLSRRIIKDKIVVSCICPGPIELPNRYMTMSQKKNNQFWRNYKKNHLPINRLAKPEEITAVVYFLTSKVASYCAGAIWNADMFSPDFKYHNLNIVLSKNGTKEDIYKIIKEEFNFKDND